MSNLGRHGNISASIVALFGEITESTRSESGWYWTRKGTLQLSLVDGSGDIRRRREWLQANFEPTFASSLGVGMQSRIPSAGRRSSGLAERARDHQGLIASANHFVPAESACLDLEQGLHSSGQ